MDLLFLIGQRIQNVLKMRLKDLTEDGILFRDKKNGRPIIVRWTDELRQAVERAKALHGPVRTVIFDRDGKKSPPLLPARAGKAPEYRTVLGQWREACAAAGVEDANPHDVRAMALTAEKTSAEEVPQRPSETMRPRPTRSAICGIAKSRSWMARRWYKGPEFLTSKRPGRKTP